ncbi:DUF3368 domain-containing protein [Tunicatimonas pelagia]|uniref:DUF3368 domain-containing protein n=1 Tax=Tunicatimonas pelagia TaxID=931531 RepID=UPI002666BAC8|nr:DUF3368 domain-containing protein [Tunicatimonas pelagia]WKN46299.1 DUF3368 domain-containing protein [Tunicatimonas pelagia]
MIIISDTSSLSGLLVIGRLDILEQVYQRVIIPQAVYEELLTLERYGYDLQAIQKATWLKVIVPSDKQLVAKLSETLDQGESEAIAASIEQNADYLLIDEKKGRAVAESLGVEVVGLVGVLIEAKELEVIDLVAPILDELRQKAGFWISEKFYSYILRKLNE